ncbi:hypothetical protein [Bacillus sp. B-jedd]|uniref:hypothetical protein n=1 Tax=Bacillus sp. B-jedd TaxID=1476857 RepID=UPI0005155CA9|nr:hypothetical protein [Bacillus sp. B-jedd]CEG25444.1 hypothetical protein BN1002_00255 [Bacillus sp. B-jedd]
MDKIFLSIDELIYCFYSEGLFEQGSALKQVYFGDLDDEKMDLLLQITCRSLLAKKLVNYKNHKFTLSDHLASVIATLNYSEQTIKASRHADNGNGEEQISFHFGEKGIIQHVLMFDEMVHEFSFVTIQQVYKKIGEYYRVGKISKENEDAFKLTQMEFEQLLLALTDNRSKFERPPLEGAKKRFNEVLEETNGLLNTLLFLEFNENKEPYATNVIMFTNSKSNNWMIEKRDDNFIVQPCNENSIHLLLEKNITAYKEKKEGLAHGK